MQRLVGLPLDGLDGYKSNSRSRHRFANSLGVMGIVFVAVHIGFHSADRRLKSIGVHRVEGPACVKLRVPFV